MSFEEFNEKLKDLGLTRRKFCNQTGLAYNSVSNWGNKKKSPPSWTNFSDLAFSDLEAQIDLFTSYKDKKGQKIYENDIVLMTLNDYEKEKEKEKDTIYKKIDSIYYTKAKGFIFSNVFDNKMNLDDDFCENCCEVIGNIHKIRIYLLI
ncbi:YopX family protein [Campylobacter vulpis]|uniref:YopX family protein n=1 Tax=Campylobacter vulpis TaxID=1655500 RepID=UPI001BCC7CBB|nr:YopX family protein [Campylobacter vulpis]MBS4407505.1 hypothetical protein [Campylobacter vulpis]